MSTKIFVNLPVKDLSLSINFFTKLGFSFNPRFTNENATCMIIGNDIFVMLLVEPFFKSFTKKQLVNASTSTEVILCLSAASREDVDGLVNKAVEAGGAFHNDKNDQGFMYQWGFEDIDGHLWEVFYMDPAALDQAGD